MFKLGNAATTTTVRKRQLKSEFALRQTLSRLFHLGQFFKCWQLFRKLSSKSTVSEFKKRKRKSLSSCVQVLHKTWICAFSRRSRVVTAKKCTKKRDARVKLLFCQFKPIAFLRLSLTSPSSLPKLPINISKDNHGTPYWYIVSPAFIWNKPSETGEFWIQLLRIARRKPDGINIEKITSVKNRKKSAINSVINVAPARKGAQREQIKRIICLRGQRKALWAEMLKT